MMFGRGRYNLIARLTPFLLGSCWSADTPWGDDDRVSDTIDILKNFSISINPNSILDDGPIAIDCDFNNDPCTYQFNGICDADAKCGAGSDCYDCDPCHQFHYDCAGCVERGCVWCPTDAFCSSAPLEAPVWNTVELLFDISISSSCLAVEDWVAACPTTDGNVFSDPLYDAMAWVYDLLNVEPVWNRGILGTGVRIRINDQGVDHLHPEFEGRFSISDSCPNAYKPQGPHGTAVASLAAGAANNGYCAAGIAPNAMLSACALPMMQEEVDSDVLASVVSAKLDDMDISLNSWGIPTCMQHLPHRRLQIQFPCQFGREDEVYSPCRYCNFITNPDTPSSPNCLNAIMYYCSLHYEEDEEACSQYLDVFTLCQYSPLTDEQEQALTDGVTMGRNGKGIIYVFSAGNAYNLGVDANFDGWVNTRFTISVGAVGKDGTHASYSTTGAALLLVGPGGDMESLRNNIVAVPGGSSCGDITIGTSFSTPYVGGVIALLLEVNPDLTWRDVQGILAQTSTQADPTDDSWMTNGAGFHHSYKYGFGIANAESAVNAAETWKLWESEQELVVDSGIVDLTIPDGSREPSSSSVSVDATVGKGIVVESVVVKLDLLHGSRGDLTIVLTSPLGTESILHPGKRPENTHLTGDEKWQLMTVRNWGESAIGEWIISLVDSHRGTLSSCVDGTFIFGWEDDLGTHYGGCETLDHEGVCVGGEMVQSYEDDIPAAIEEEAKDACCACGGGMPASTENLLRSWQLIVYGHEVATISSDLTLSSRNSKPVAPTHSPSTLNSTTTSPTGSVNPSTTSPTEASLSPADQPVEVDALESLSQRSAATSSRLLSTMLCVLAPCFVMMKSFSLT